MFVNRRFNFKLFVRFKQKIETIEVCRLIRRRWAWDLVVEIEEELLALALIRWLSVLLIFLPFDLMAVLALHLLPPSRLLLWFNPNWIWALYLFEPHLCGYLVDFFSSSSWYLFCLYLSSPQSHVLSILLIREYCVYISISDAWAATYVSLNQTESVTYRFKIFFDWPLICGLWQTGIWERMSMIYV